MPDALEKRFKILIVDDVDADRAVLRSTLFRLGHRDVQEANDGAMALQKIELANSINQKFDMVIMDWQMPKMTGIQLLKALRHERTNKELLVVMTTAESAIQQVTDAMIAGVNGYIVKPVEEGVLRLKIEKLLKKSS